MKRSILVTLGIILPVWPICSRAVAGEPRSWVVPIMELQGGIDGPDQKTLAELSHPLLESVQADG